MDSVDAMKGSLATVAICRCSGSLSPTTERILPADSDASFLSFTTAEHIWTAQPNFRLTEENGVL